MVSKNVQPGGQLSYQQSPGGPLTPQNRSGVLPELSAASANQKPNQLLKELLTAKVSSSINASIKGINFCLKLKISRNCRFKWIVSSVKGSLLYVLE